MSKDRIALPLDVPNLSDARALATRLADEVGVMKVGLQLFIAEGPAAVQVVRDAGVDCFLDLKLHDIPATVAKASAAAAELGVRYCTVHASAGSAALRAAVEATEGSGMQLLAVTALTSLDDASLRSIGFTGGTHDVVATLAKLAFEAGVRGFVCSPHEAAGLRDLLGPSATLVTPGVRPATADADDQRRVATPAEAIRAGADLLVIGRPIRNARDPVAAARAIAEEIASA